jgi:hypothetical protein
VGIIARSGFGDGSNPHAEASGWHEGEVLAALNPRVSRVRAVRDSVSRDLEIFAQR